MGRPGSSARLKGVGKTGGNAVHAGARKSGPLSLGGGARQAHLTGGVTVGGGPAGRRARCQAARFEPVQSLTKAGIVDAQVLPKGTPGHRLGGIEKGATQRLHEGGRLLLLTDKLKMCGVLFDEP